MFKEVSDNLIHLVAIDLKKLVKKQIQIYNPIVIGLK